MYSSMSGRLSFAFSKDAAVPTQGGRISKVNEESLRTLGFELSSTQGPPAYSFSAMGGWNPSFRASIVRIAMMKLLGSGVVAAFLSISPHAGRYTGFSLSFSAGVNFVATYFYYRIWQLRAQLFGGDKYNRFTAIVGREQVFQGPIAQEEGEPLNKTKEEQDAHDQHVIYWQEVEVDGCRCAYTEPCVPLPPLHAPVTPWSLALCTCQIRRLAGTFTHTPTQTHLHSRAFL